MVETIPTIVFVSQPLLSVSQLLLSLFLQWLELPQPLSLSSNHYCCFSSCCFNSSYNGWNYPNHCLCLPTIIVVFPASAFSLPTIFVHFQPISLTANHYCCFSSCCCNSSYNSWNSPKHCHCLTTIIVSFPASAFTLSTLFVHFQPLSLFYQPILLFCQRLVFLI